MNILIIESGFDRTKLKEAIKKLIELGEIPSDIDEERLEQLMPHVISTLELIDSKESVKELEIPKIENVIRVGTPEDLFESRFQMLMSSYDKHKVDIQSIKKENFMKGNSYFNGNENRVMKLKPNENYNSSAKRRR